MTTPTDGNPPVTPTPIRPYVDVSKKVNKATIRIMNAHQRMVASLELRKAGVDYQTIADTVGYKNVASAWQAVKRGMAMAIHEPAKELIDLELLRLDDWLRWITPQIKAGNLHAVDRGLKIMERRAKLLGLDAQATMTITHQHIAKIAQQLADDDDIDVAEVIAEAERIMRDAGLS